MATELECSGERMIEDAYRQTPDGWVIYLMHIASYRFAASYCKGKRVLDLGCGSGYGAALIAEIAASVTAVDISAEAIAYANEHYRNDNIRFARIEKDEPLPFADESFDVVLSFQVIEHVADTENYLREAARVLSLAGTLILITPDRAHRLLPGQRPWNRWHLKEYSPESCRRMVASSAFVPEKVLRMHAPVELADIEMKRYARLKWLTFPFTFPGAPEWWRQFGLGLLHAINNKKNRINATRNNAQQHKAFLFDGNNIFFTETGSPSLNIVVVAHHRNHAD
jgi:2-polyprenyl-3-methyl-5-hydroxy-6-metoxy-1,4-benzoquinol methylase